jgi:hypothetical protein
MGAADFRWVSPGAGLTRSLLASTPDEPALRSPAPESLLQWSTENPHGLRSINTVVVDAGDDVSLGLLRGRLMQGQNLLLTRVTGMTSELAAELRATESSEQGLTRVSEIPMSWLDPLDSCLQPDPHVVGSQTWPRISIVLVSFNQVAFLEEGIRSVLRQRYPNLEFIVVDGNSSDGSIEVLERYRNQFSYLAIEPDHGQSDGLNKGFAQARGEILGWLNSDDLLEPGALFRVAQAFTAYPVDMVAGGCRQIGLTRDRVLFNHHNRLPLCLPVLLPLGLLLEMERFWLTGNFFYQPEVFFSRNLWTRSGGKLRTDLHYVLDYDLWVRMAAAGATVVHIPDFLACSRTHEQQKTTVAMRNMPEVQDLMGEYASRLLTPAGLR